MSYKPVALALILCSPFVLSLPAGRQEVPQVQHSPFKSSEPTAPSSGGLQAFTGALGGQAAPSVTVGGQGFQVAGEAGSFPNKGAALGRSCDIQHTNCVEFANSADGRVAGLTFAQCDEQNTKCCAVTADTPPSKQPSASPPAAQAPAAPKTPNTPNTAPESPGGPQTSKSGPGGEAASPGLVDRRGFRMIVRQEGNKGAAPTSSCDVQHNECVTVANSAAGRAEGLTVAQCDQQNAKCLSDAASNSPPKQPPASSPAAQVPTAPKTPNTPNSAVPSPGNIQTSEAGAVGDDTGSVGRRGFIQVAGAAENKDTACDDKYKKCVSAANSAVERTAGQTVDQCDQQNAQCRAGGSD